MLFHNVGSWTSRIFSGISSKGAVIEVRRRERNRKILRCAASVGWRRPDAREPGPCGVGWPKRLRQEHARPHPGGDRAARRGDLVAEAGIDS